MSEACPTQATRNRSMELAGSWIVNVPPLVDGMTMIHVNFEIPISHSNLSIDLLELVRKQLNSDEVLVILDFNLVFINSTKNKEKEVVK